MPVTAVSHTDRFWKYVLRQDGEKCWVWLGRNDRHGYGLFARDESGTAACHRISWALEYGRIPEGKYVFQACNNRLCVRPDHLILGSRQTSNIDIAIRKRRAHEEMRAEKTPEKRFWRRVAKGSRCWEWKGSRAHTGHGRVRILGKVWLAHRYAWTITNGPIPSGLLVRHKCDNGWCVNPDHLCLGTHQDNTNDKVERGRAWSAPGEANPSAKLTAADVAKIRAMGGTKTDAQLATEYRVSASAVNAVQSRRTWRHL